MDALLRLLTEKESCCSFYHLITGDVDPDAIIPWEVPEVEFQPGDHLNDSQQAAVMSPTQRRLSLIWGPPGNLTSLGDAAV